MVTSNYCFLNQEGNTILFYKLFQVKNSAKISNTKNMSIDVQSNSEHTQVLNEMQNHENFSRHEDESRAILDPLEEDVPYTKNLTPETSPFKEAVKGFVINKLGKKVGSSHILSGITEKIVKKLDDNKDSIAPTIVHTSESDLNLRRREVSVDTISTSISCEINSVLTQASSSDVAVVDDAIDCLEEFSSPFRIPSSSLRSNSISLPSSPAHRFQHRASSISGSLEKEELLNNKFFSSHLSSNRQTFKDNDSNQSNETEHSTNTRIDGGSYLNNAYSGKAPEKLPLAVTIYKTILNFILLLKSIITSISLTHLFLLAAVVVHNIEMLPNYFTFAFDGLSVAYIFYSYLCIWVQSPASSPTLKFPFVDINFGNASLRVTEIKNISKGCVKILRGEYDPEMVKNHPTDLVEISVEECGLVLVRKRNGKETELVRYNLLGAKIMIVPKGLSKKRIWNKKYPICVALPSSTSMECLKKETNQEAIYLFTLTDREKESLFWVLFRNTQIDSSVASCDKASSKIPSTSLLESNSEESLSLNRDEEDESWENLDVHLEFSTYMSNLFENFERMNKFHSKTRSFEDLTSSYRRDHRMSKDDTFLSDLTCDHPVDWLNLVLGRVFYDFLTQKQWSDEVKSRIQKKLDSIEMPTFIESLVVTEVYLGTSLPQMHKVSNPVLDTNGVWLNFDFNYCGSFQMTLTTKLKISKDKPFPTSLDGYETNKSSASIPSDESSEDEGNLSKAPADKKKKFIDRIEKWVSHRHFQAVAQSKFVKKYVGDISKVPLTLTVELSTLHGILTLNIPPAPTDRIWYGFRRDPVLNLNVYPKVGTREINLSAVVQMIEKKLIQEFKKAIVMPNMDDLLVPIMFSPAYNF